MVANRVFVPLGQGVDRVFGSAADWVGDGKSLSDRLWLARKMDRDAIDKILRHGLMTGADPIAVAKDLEDYLTPAAQLARFPEGHPRAGQVKPFSQQPKGVATRTPRGGMGNAAARTLARTETSHAFNAAALQAADLNPFVYGMRWLKSSNHPKADQCDLNAQGSSRGFPPGVYRISEFPQIPSHPNCRCVASPEVVQDEAVVIAQLRRDAGLDGEPTLVAQPRSSAWEKVVTLFRTARALVTREAA